MRTLRNILTLFAIVAFTAAYGQMENKQTEKETMVKTYQVETSKGTMDYTIKVDTKKANWVTMEKEELAQKEQTRVQKPKKITKIISIMGDEDKSFDNVLHISYKAMNDDDFKIYPTKAGFNVKAVGKEFKYSLLDRNYTIDKDHKDFFEVSMAK